MNDRGGIIVFPPHPDDETLACGGTVAKKITEGHKVSVVFMTDGRNAQPNPFAHELKAIRKEEAKRATKILGVEEKDLVFLDFEDGMLKEHELVARTEVSRILSERRPLEVYFPHAHDCHIDHRATHIVVGDSISNLSLCTAMYQYWIHFRGLALLRYLGSNLLGRQMVEVDVSEFLTVKKRALDEYKSQIAVLSPEQDRPVLSDVFLGSFLESRERFRRLTK